jgi:hypothetical protein
MQVSKGSSSQPPLFEDEPTRPAVVACVSNETAKCRLNEAFGSRLLMVPFAHDLQAALLRVRYCLLIVEPFDHGSASVASVVPALLKDRTVVDVIVYASVGHGSLREILRLGAAGVTRVLIRDIDDSPRELRELVLSHISTRLVRCLLSSTPHLPAALRSVAAHCLDREGRAECAEELALAMGVTSRTLTNWACKAGFGGIGEFVSRCRVLYALGCAYEHKGSVENLSLRLAFTSAAHLNGMVRRYAGMSLRNAMRVNDYGGWCRTLLATPLQSLACSDH